VLRFAPSKPNPNQIMTGNKSRRALVNHDAIYHRGRSFRGNDAFTFMARSCAVHRCPVMAAPTQPCRTVRTKFLNLDGRLLPGALRRAMTLRRPGIAKNASNWNDPVSAAQHFAPRRARDDDRSFYPVLQPSKK